jgi:hypothetical protein
MESSNTHLSGDDIERILEETLSDSESSLFDSDDDSSAIEGLRTHEASDSEGNWEIQQVLCRAGLVIRLLCGRTCLR